MQTPTPKSIGYLPQHPVRNQNKPTQLRRVANAASKFRGESLNSNLLTGPDLLNNLDGNLLRFREHPVAVLSDIKRMIMQITARQKDQSALRFLWMIDNNIRQLQLTRLIFGATSSPLNKIQFPAALNAIKRYFYVDDYIQSLTTLTQGKNSISQTKDCPKKAAMGRNKTEILAETSDDDKEETKGIMRVLGQKWNVMTDGFLMFPLQSPKDAAMYTQIKLLVWYRQSLIPSACCLL